MSKVILNDTTMTAIGNAIRSKTGTTDLLLPSAMPSAISNIQTNSGNTDGGIKWKMATITPTTDAVSVDISPWITDTNINDWFMYGSFGYWAMSDVNLFAGTQLIGPVLRDLTPTHGTKDGGWNKARLAQEGSQPQKASSAYPAHLMWNNYRPFTWNPTTKVLTWTNTNYLGKTQIILVYREV